MPDNNPTISVVMAVYNGEKYLAEAITSILTQTFQDFEFIIVDDASTDTSPSIIQRLAQQENRIRVIRNEENVGLGSSLQKGIQIARGKYIARMDADDISLPDRLQKQLDFLDLHSSFLIVGCDHKKIGVDGSVISNFFYPKDPDQIRWNMLLGSGLIVSNGAALLRRQLIDEIGSYSDLRAAQDFEFWTRLFEHVPLPIANMDEILYHYREHGSTTTRSQNSVQEHNAMEIRLKKIEQFLGKPVPPDVLLAYRHPSFTYQNIELCVRTWIKIYRKFIQKFEVSSEARREIQTELISRLNKYSYIPPQKNNTQYRVSLWKLLSWLPIDLALRLMLFKIVWVLKRL